MNETGLRPNVYRFVSMFANRSDDFLESEWAWGSYNTEGVRFAFFRILEILVGLRVELQTYREEGSLGQNLARSILAGYHRAYMELEGSLWDVDNPAAEEIPAPEEWSVKRTLTHIVQGDLGFYGVCRNTLDRSKQGREQAGPSEEDWDRILEISDEEFGEIGKKDLGELKEFHDVWHKRILMDFSQLPDSSLELGSIYWETESLPLRFRLGRFESHLRQHQIQIDRILFQIGQPPSEAKMLTTMLFSALADVENAPFTPEIGASPFYMNSISEIENTTASVAKALQSTT